MKRIGFLVDKSCGQSPEEHAAWRFLSSQKSHHSTRISFQSLNRQSATRNLPHFLWWHFDSSTILPQAAVNPDTTSLLRDYIRRGGSLIVSLLAAQYVLDLGIEEARPNRVIKGTWDEANWAPDYPDIRGFATYRGHPIFKGLPGGVYTWNPSQCDDFSGSFYDGIEPINGKIVAVERQYIKLNEDRRVISEYEFGKGKILVIGTYFFFKEQRARFRKHLELFASNCLWYLSDRSRSAGERKSFWNFDVRTVTEVRQTSRLLENGSVSLRAASGNPSLKRDLASTARPEQFFDVGGKRILTMGKEPGGIEEIWCHPVRIVRNLRIAFKVGNGPLRWNHELKPVFLAQPECIVRTYTIEDATIQETVFCDRDRPSGALHFHINSSRPVEIIVTANVDLRLMWPLSDKATGSLTYAWDKNLRAAVVVAPHPQLSALIGSSVTPDEYSIGRFSSFEISNDTFIGKSTDEVVVATAMRYRLSASDREFALLFASSQHSKQEAEQAYRAIAKNPAYALKNHSRYFQRLLSKSTRIETPDPEFNEAYQWALVSTDRFFADVPGLGSSLLAGFGTTEEGWNGGHRLNGRPGYAWFFGRDSVWTSFAVLSYGDVEKVKNVIEFLGQHQDPSGKIPHEVTTSGFAHYDAADSTPLFIVLMGKYLKATGDTKFVKRHFDRLQKAVEFCFSTDTDHDHLIENTDVGHGWVEGGKLFPVHCEHYLASCWAKALQEAADIASVLRKKNLVKTWNTEAKRVTRIVENDFWNERTQFYNFGKRIDGSYNEEKTLLPAVGISFGCGVAKRAEKCLEAYASADFSADWGTRIVGKDNPMYNPSGYHYGSVWPLFTGWTSLAEFRMGRPIQGYVHAANNLLLYNQFAAGSIEEVLHGESFQPAGVCPHQAWSESMALQPLIDGMLGFEPDATRSALALRPYFPADWPSARISNLRLGGNRIGVEMKRGAGLTSYEFGMKRGKPVAITLQPYLPLGSRVLEIRINGKVLGAKRKIVRRYDDCPTIRFRLTTKTIVEFRHADGIALVPPVPHPVPGQQSKGLHVINESWEHRKYVLTLEGRAGRSYSINIIDSDSLIRSVDGGRIVGRNGARVMALVDFEQAANPEAYLRKRVSFNTV